jgi:transposase
MDCQAITAWTDKKSFVTAVEIRELRDLTRFRKKWIGHLTSEKNRIQKVLERSNVKLGTVISDVFGVLGRKLLKKLVEQGYVDAEDVESSIHGIQRPIEVFIFTEKKLGAINML